MAVTTTMAKVEYSGNGSTSSFLVPFRFMEASHLQVRVVNNATGAETVPAYTVTGVGSSSGGSLTLSAPLATGYTLRISRTVPLTQPTVFRLAGTFSPRSHEDAFDRAAMMALQTDTKVDTIRSEVLAAVSDLNGESHAATSQSSVLAYNTPTPRTLTARFADQFNVKDYGAVGDGVADDTAAIQAAMNASRDGGIVFLPPGRYKVTATLVPAKYSGNTGNAWGTLQMRGSGNPFVDDIYGTYSYGSAIFMASPQANVPVFDLTATRGIHVESLAIIGSASKVSNSVAVASTNVESQSVFRDVTFAGWDACVRIGVSGETVSGNNDFWAFNDCYFRDANVGILNYGIESYMVRANDCTFFTDIAYRTVGHADGTVMNSFKAHHCFFACGTTIVKYEGAGSTHSGRDIIVLDSCLSEPSGAVACAIFVSDALAANNNLGLIIHGCTFNTSDVAGVYDPAFRAIRYAGRGPFIFDGNIAGGAGRFPVEIITYASGWEEAAVSWTDNIFTTARPVFIRSKGAALPYIYERGNQVIAEGRHKITDGFIASYSHGRPEPVVVGRRTNALAAPNVCETWLSGSTYRTGGNGSPVTEAVCRQAGTTGTISGVTATLTSGNDYATFTAGSVAERNRIHAGCYITIGAASYLEVLDVVGDTIYLHATWGGATQTAQAVSFATPFFRLEQTGGSAAPTTGTWSVGDVAWNASAATGPIGWKCTVAGTPGTWVALYANQAAAQADSVAADVATLKTDFNSLLAKLRTAGALAP